MSNDDERDSTEDELTAWVELGKAALLQCRADHARHGGCYVDCCHDPGRLHPGEDNNPRTGFAYND
jgi:hypothetical protein